MVNGRVAGFPKTQPGSHGQDTHMPRTYVIISALCGKPRPEMLVVGQRLGVLMLISEDDLHAGIERLARTKDANIECRASVDLNAVSAPHLELG